MSSSIEANKIARNTIYLTVAYIIQKILSFGYFIYYARFVGYVGTGQYVFATSFVIVIGIIIDLGLNPVLIREVARVKGRANKYLNNILGLKFLFAIIAYILVVILINVIGDPAQETKNLVYLAGVMMVLESFTLSIYGIFRAFQNLKYEAIGTIIYQTLAMVVGVVGFQITQNILVLGVAIIVGSLGNFLFALFSLIKKAEVRPRLEFDFSFIKSILIIALPFFIAGVFTKVYAYIDIVLLSLLKGTEGDQYTGWYSAAYKLTYAIQFIPLAFNNSIYPAFSAFFIKSKELLARTFEDAVFYLIAIALPISFGVFALADKVTVLLGSQYQESIPALQISILGLVFIFVNFILNSLLNAANRQRIYMINMGLVVAFNIIMNVILIPRLNHLGASLAALFSAIFLFGLGTYWSRKIIEYNWLKIFEKALKSFFAAFTMAFLIFILKKEINFIFLIPLGAIYYICILYLIRGFTKGEIIQLYQQIFKKTS